jgi:hypothetical protein
VGTFARAWDDARGWAWAHLQGRGMMHGVERGHICKGVGWCTGLSVGTFAIWFVWFCPNCVFSILFMIQLYLSFERSASCNVFCNVFFSFLCFLFMFLILVPGASYPFRPYERNTHRIFSIINSRIEFREKIVASQHSSHFDYLKVIHIVNKHLWTSDRQAWIQEMNAPIKIYIYIFLKNMFKSIKHTNANWNEVQSQVIDETLNFVKSLLIWVLVFESNCLLK